MPTSITNLTDIVWFSSLLSAAWLIGTLIGINLLFDGVWQHQQPSGQRRALNLEN